MAITGLETIGPPFYKLFDTRSAARQWIASLPEYPTEDQVDRAMKGWGTELINYLTTHPKAIQREEGEVASLIVSFKSGGKSHFYKERIGTSSNGEVLRDPGGSLRIALEDNKYFSNFSGSCRDLAEDEGKYSGGITPQVSAILRNLSGELYFRIASINDLVGLAMKFEEELAHISKNHRSARNMGDIIGPPFQSVTLSPDSNRWVPHFKSPCP